MRHVCYLWIDPATRRFEVDRCDHPLAEIFPAYIDADAAFNTHTLADDTEGGSTD